LVERFLVRAEELVDGRAKFGREHRLHEATVGTESLWSDAFEGLSGTRQRAVHEKAHSLLVVTDEHRPGHTGSIGTRARRLKQ
jgi:hypothetical protein